jgi:imipenem/basic amino acid-specific outer membrane pore
MNDVRMVPNSFTGILVTNADITDTTVYAAHLTDWISVDSEKPEDFIDLLGSDSVNVLGVVYQGIDHVELQTW